MVVNLPRELIFEKNRRNALGMVRDIIHNTVKRALIKDGWNITHDPFPIRVGGFEMEIDLGAEETVAAEKNGEKIAVLTTRSSR